MPIRLLDQLNDVRFGSLAVFRHLISLTAAFGGKANIQIAANLISDRQLTARSGHCSDLLDGIFLLPEIVDTSDQAKYRCDQNTENHMYYYFK